MNPVEFEEQTNIIGAPKGVSEKECGGLPVITLNNEHGNHVGFASCWELTEDEWLDIRNNGMKFWLVVHSNRHPMVALSVDKPFTMPENVQE